MNLSNNEFGGYHGNYYTESISTPEGPKAIADALLANGSLTSVRLASNPLTLLAPLLSCNVCPPCVSVSACRLISQATYYAVSGWMSMVTCRAHTMRRASTRLLMHFAFMVG